MTSPGAGRDRRTQIGLFLIAVSVVLIVSSVTWFSSGRPGVGVAQLVVGGVLGAVVIVYLRLARRW
jgi:multisubunit Na+/H+ antiporter MnhB subunit